jgi:hypothetical protein
VHSEFYATAAQIFATAATCLYLGLGLPGRVRVQRRRKRFDGPDGVSFRTKTKVRVYTLFVGLAVICALGISMFELGGILPDDQEFRVVVACALIIALATMMARIYFGVISATASAPTSDDDAPRRRR